ncbi:Transposase (fragment 1) [Mycobacterium canettii CIPT 140070010]|nr:Transposase (fragment 1) [Mycobacterium canettii CIPT 140070010]
MHDATGGAGFVRPDLTAFCRLDELGVEVTGQPLGRRPLQPRPSPRPRPPSRRTHPRPRLALRHLALLARRRRLRSHPTPSPAGSP